MVVIGNIADEAMDIELNSSGAAEAIQSGLGFGFS